MIEIVKLNRNSKFIKIKFNSVEESRIFGVNKPYILTYNNDIPVKNYINIIKIVILEDSYFLEFTIIN
jgi:hypothetical protein|nr:MAG TPA: hypothetical protein [Caudoviricetes sp.]